MEMEPLYKPAGVEERWQRVWEEEGLYRADPASERPSYVIAVPPPNVTGVLHMGHALNASIQDVLVRWHRLRGFNTLWQPGYDHAGIATQAVVEKQLRSEGTSRLEIGREAFLERVWAWLREYGGVIMGQFRRLGCSLAYGREVIVPVVERRVPVIADERVERDFGTGALKVTPGHDPVDFEIGREHGLPEPAVIDLDGRMTGDIPEKLIGLTEEDAAEYVLDWLRRSGRLEKRESFRHAVGHCERSGTRVQPLVSLQWWCAMDDLAKPAIAALESGSVT